MPARGGAGKRRRTRSLDERKRIVEEALALGISVAAVARRHDLNANLIFKWIRRSREGWREPAKEGPALGSAPLTCKSLLRLNRYFSNHISVPCSFACVFAVSGNKAR